jgi:hypothetical protein
MTIVPALAVLVVISAVLALPFLIMRTAARGGSGLLRIVRGAGFVAVAIAVGGTIVTLSNLIGPTATITVPVSTMPIRVPDGVTFELVTARLIGGGFDRATVTVEGLSLTTKLVMGASSILWTAVVVTVVVVVLRLVRSLGEGDPFALGSTALVKAGWAVMAGGAAAAWVGTLGDWFASKDVFEVWGWSSTKDLGDGADLTALGWPSPGAVQLGFPWIPLVAGLALFVLAAVFRSGAQLRQDTEGLV